MLKKKQFDGDSLYVCKKDWKFNSTIYNHLVSSKKFIVIYKFVNKILKIYNIGKMVLKCRI